MTDRQGWLSCGISVRDEINASQQKIHTDGTREECTLCTKRSRSGVKRKRMSVYDFGMQKPGRRYLPGVVSEHSAKRNPG